MTPYEKKLLKQMKKDLAKFDKDKDFTACIAF